MTSEPRIALIDDDPLWIESLEEMLSDQGFSISVASDGQDGLTLLERNLIPVAVVDYQMPELDGLELLQRVRELEHPVAILLVSGDEDPTLAQKAKQEGAFAFYPKTVSPRLLLHGVLSAWDSLN